MVHLEERAVEKDRVEAEADPREVHDEPDGLVDAPAELAQLDEDPPVDGESGSTDIRELLLVFLKVFRAFGVFSKVFRAFGTPKLVGGCHLTTALVQWLADGQI